MKHSTVMKLLGFIFTITILGFIFSPSITHASSIIDINARTNSDTNPIVMFFTAGTYDVIPIGTADGGAYNAWNAWGHVSLPEHGWINGYTISSSHFGVISIGDVSIRYATDLLALANASSTTFTLAEDGNVNFYITDSAYSDNIGGMSLLVNTVPIPGALWLLGSGLIGLLGLRKKLLQ